MNPPFRLGSLIRVSPRLFWVGAVLALLTSLLFHAPAWAIAVQMAAWGTVIRLLLGLYEVQIHVLDELRRARKEGLSPAPSPLFPGVKPGNQA
jgi:hypothetical protein